MCHNFFVCSSVDGQLGCFHVLAIVNSAAMNIGVHVSSSILVSSGYMPRSGIAGSHDGFFSPTALQQGALFTSGLFSVGKLHKKAGRAVYFVHSYILTSWNTAGAQ